MFRLPGWLVFLVFVPLQIFLFVKLVGAWGFWWSLVSVFLVGILATRAARAPLFRSMLFPAWADRWESRRHLFQGILLLAAAVAYLAAWGPQPWLPLVLVVSLVKSAVS